MKTLKTMAVLFVLLLSITPGCLAQKGAPTAKVNFISENDGTITMRSIGIGKNQNDATIDAEKNAFNVLLFRGVPESDQKAALVGTKETEEKEKQKAYFEKFYNGKRYKTFLMSSIPASDLVKIKKEGKSMSVDVKINLIALRKDLEENNVIRHFGF